MGEVFHSLDGDVEALDQQQSMMAAMATQQSAAVATISRRVTEAASAMSRVTSEIGAVVDTMAKTADLASVSQATAHQLTELAAEMDRF